MLYPSSHPKVMKAKNYCCYIKCVTFSPFFLPSLVMVAQVAKMWAKAISHFFFLSRTTHQEMFGIFRESSRKLFKRCPRSRSGYIIYILLSTFFIRVPVFKFRVTRDNKTYFSKVFKKNVKNNPLYKTKDLEALNLTFKLRYKALWKLGDNFMIKYNLKCFVS